MQKKTSDKIQHLFMAKTQQSKFRGNIPQYNDKPTDNIILKGKKLNAFLLRLE